jgi:hypothetical protein
MSLILPISINISPQQRAGYHLVLKLREYRLLSEGGTTRTLESLQGKVAKIETENKESSREMMRRLLLSLHER